jgi:4-hydroxyphenylacetate 3-hydroxylase, reductase component
MKQTMVESAAQMDSMTIDPAEDVRGFRKCLGQFATGVTVITTQTPDGPVGLTANSFSSLSLDPPLILWSIDLKSSRFRHFHEAEAFTINILASDQVHLSNHFTTAGPEKFDEVGWVPGKNGAPILNDVAGFLECTKHGEHVGGDHLIMIGKVGCAFRSEAEVLLFAQGKYGVPAEHPDNVRSVVVSDPELPVTRELKILATLFRANNRLTAEFGRYRAEMSRDEHRVLIEIENRPGITLSELAEKTYLGLQATEDAVELFARKGWLDNTGDTLRLSEKGQQRRADLAQRLYDMENDLLIGLPKAVLDSTLTVLQRLAGD